MDIKKLFRVTLYKEFCEKVFNSAKITAVILFLFNALGIWLIFLGLSPLVCQNQ